MNSIMDNSIFKFIFPIILGYLFGCIQTSYFLGKFKFGVDVKSQGSKNAGASNSVLLFGWKFGIFVGFIDMLKSYIPMFIIFSIYSQDSLFLASLAGGGAILGHTFPFFMNFNGGKGMSCYFGMLMGLDFLFGIAVFIIGGLLVMLTNYVAASTILVLITVPFILYFLCDVSNLNLIISVSFFSCIIFIKHIENIRKIYKGTETTFWSVMKK